MDHNFGIKLDKEVNKIEYISALTPSDAFR